MSSNFRVQQNYLENLLNMPSPGPILWGRFWGLAKRPWLWILNLPHHPQASLIPIVCGLHFEKCSLVLVLDSFTSFSSREIGTDLAILARHKPMRSIQKTNSIVVCLVCWGGFIICFCQFRFLIVAHNWCPINICLCWTKSLFDFFFFLLYNEWTSFSLNYHTLLLVLGH